MLTHRRLINSLFNAQPCPPYLHRLASLSRFARSSSSSSIAAFSSKNAERSFERMTAFLEDAAALNNKRRLDGQSSANLSSSRNSSPILQELAIDLRLLSERGHGASPRNEMALLFRDLQSAFLKPFLRFSGSKLPKGFGGGGSGSASETKEASGSETSSKSKATADGGDGAKKKGSEGGGGSKKEDENGDGQNNMDPWTVLLSSLAISYALWTLFGTGGQPYGQEISWQEFRNTFLSTGMVDRLDIINKDYVRVSLRNTPNFAFIEGSGSQSSSSSSSSSNSADAAYDSLFASMGALSQEREAELRKALEDARAHKTIFFRIGSVESFERQLEDAQIDLHVRPRDFVLVRHVSEADISQRVASLMPYILLLAVYAGLLRMMGGGGAGAGIGGMGGGANGINRVFSIGKAKPAVFNKDSKVKVTFKDVAGCDEAKAEIMEFVQFLKDPSRFTALGAKIPKGALLVGPPGTGKTLLAKATAGEAGSPFFSMSGSDFIEMFVGVGPSRVRDLFQQARAAAPCIIFIDEIDAVARSRNKGGFGGGNDERENTLNQLLVEMDGFSTTEGVVVLAGTNRADILDKAILRPGRFDRQIMVDKPDIQGRKEIFRVHMKQIKLSGDPALYSQRLAALTPGFVGADIANICNEAAIHAARGAKDKVDLKDFEAAIDRVVGGLERRNNVMTEAEKRTVAFHEAGHAIAGWFLEHADPLLKVTIIPRSSGALGFAQYLPKEVALFSREALVDRMCMALGGRVSEELNFGRITTGASDDLDKVTQMAYAMTTIYGMNERVGSLSFPKREETQFEKPYSDATAQVIDEEVKKLVDACYARTKELLTTHAAKVKGVAELLLERETISQKDLADVAGQRPFPINAKLAEYISQGWGEQAEKYDKAEQPVEANTKNDDNNGGGPVLVPI
jgi:AFG3 family protein